MTSLIAAMILSAALYAQPGQNMWRDPNQPCAVHNWCAPANGSCNYSFHVFQRYAAYRRAHGKPDFVLHSLTFISQDGAHIQQFWILRDGSIELDGITPEDGLRLEAAQDMLREMDSSTTSGDYFPKSSIFRPSAIPPSRLSMGVPAVCP